jgi:hypothetical protein
MAPKNAILALLLLIGTSLWAKDRDVSIGSIAVGGGKPWQWTIFTKGTPDALAHIKCVQYMLDPSFPTPSRTVCSRGSESQAFSSSGTAWGRFTLSATVTFDDGDVQRLQYTWSPQEGDGTPSIDENAKRDTKTYFRNGWSPIDMAFNPDSGLVVLDHDGKISSVIVDPNGIHLETLPLNISLSSKPIVIAASKESVFVSTNNLISCTVFRYSFANRQTSQKALTKVDVGQAGCDGIATDGVGIFLIIPGRRQIRYWSDFNSSNYIKWDSPVPASDPASGSLNFNDTCHCLIFASVSGTAYTLSPQQGKWSKVTENLGYVHSITSDSTRILFASGNKVLFYSTSKSHREEAPPSMQSLTGGIISGVALDSSGSAWIADSDNGIIKGPIPLN